MTTFSSIVIDSLLRTWQSQREYAQRLTDPIPARDMLRQPIAGVRMNHAAWTFSHLGVYPPVLAAMILGQPFTDPLTSAYGRDSAPTDTPGDYLPKADLMGAFFKGHDALGDALRAGGESALLRPIPLARWEPRFPRILDAAIHLMTNHEAGHLGQVSAWRRACGWGSV